MDPLTLSALAAGVPAVAKGVTGIIQGIKGRRLGKTPRPVYETPGEIQRMISTAQTRAAVTKMPGQELMEEKIGGVTADVMGKARDVADPMAYLSTVSGAAGRQTEALQDIGIAAAGDKARREKEAQEALLLGAQYKDKEFDINKMQPYQAAQASASALREASTTNITGAISDVAGVASSMIGVGGTTPTTGATGDVLKGEQVATPTSGGDISSLTSGMSQVEINRLRTTNPQLYNMLFGGQ